VVKIARRAGLDELAVFEDGEAIGDAEGFFLIVGDVDGGEAGGFADAADFAAHFQSQFCVEVTEGFVEQKAGGMNGEGAGEGNALLLAAGELGRAAVGIGFHADHGEGFGGAFFLIGFTEIANGEAEANVLHDGHVGPEGVTLKAHHGVAMLGADAGDIEAVEGDLAGGGFEQTGDETQKSAFAAAAGAEEEEKFAGFYFEGDIAQGGRGGGIEAFGEVGELDAGHFMDAFCLQMNRGNPHPSPPPEYSERGKECEGVVPWKIGTDPIIKTAECSGGG